MMKNFWSAAALSLLLTACGNNNSKTKTDKTDTPKLTVAILSTPHDYVCGMDLERDEFVADTTLYEGKILGFCAPECKQEFLKNPQQFLSQQ